MLTLGVDIGGTKIKAGVINQEGRITAHIEERTDKNRLMDQVFSLLDRLAGKENDFGGIGIATAGMVDAEKGTIHYATPNLPGWTGTQVKELVEKRYRIPVYVDNDANCAAYAEMKLGAARYTKNIMCLTLGTGVGAGIILNGQLFHGGKGGAGDIGHMIYMPNGTPCNCGKKGCWEQYVSGTALESEIRKSFEGEVTPEEVFRLAGEKHPDAAHIVDSYLTNLATGIISLQSILDLQLFVVGGGVINSSQYWWNPFLGKLRSISKFAPMVKKAILKNDAGMIGASLMLSGKVHCSATIPADAGEL
ncbi:ROK family protein [Bacillus infantis]|uniref:ROK family protein n=1 Tax=Bacillus infantis TaxID=324767 RepID=UPI003CE90F13